MQKRKKEKPEKTRKLVLVDVTDGPAYNDAFEKAAYAYAHQLEQEQIYENGLKNGCKSTPGTIQS